MHWTIMTKTFRPFSRILGLNTTCCKTRCNWIHLIVVGRLLMQHSSKSPPSLSDSPHSVRMSWQVQAHVYKGELHPSSGTAAVQEHTLVIVAVTGSYACKIIPSTSLMNTWQNSYYKAFGIRAWASLWMGGEAFQKVATAASGPTRASWGELTSPQAMQIFMEDTARSLLNESFMTHEHCTTTSHLSTCTNTHLCIWSSPVVNNCIKTHLWSKWHI